MVLVFSFIHVRWIQTGRNVGMVRYLQGTRRTVKKMELDYVHNVE
jgi:hypothetical protein